MTTAEATSLTSQALGALLLDAIKGNLDGVGGTSLAASLKQHGLGGFIYGVLPRSHPLKASFRDDFLIAGAQHGIIKAELIELIRHWNAHGIEPLMYKGFALAEFIYPNPAGRYYGDVDLLVPKPQARQAADLAIQAGWREDWRRNDSFVPHSHEESHLFSPLSGLRLDLHFYPLHTYTPMIPFTTRFSQHLWARSSTTEWEGVKVRIPQPIDAALALILAKYTTRRYEYRFWNLLDLHYLSLKGGFGMAELMTLAGQFGVSRCVSHFLERCSPWQGVVELGRPSRSYQKKRQWNLILEDGLEWVCMVLWLWLIYLPGFFLDALWQWKGVRRVIGLMRQHSDMEELLRRVELPPKPAPNPSGKRIIQITRGVRWCLWWIGLRTDNCVPKSLAIFSALRQEGHPAVFVSGVRRENGKLQGHAWVELYGLPLDGSGDEAAPLIYKENFRYPLPTSHETTK